MAGTLSLAVNSDHESNGEGDTVMAAKKEPTLKLLRASGDTPLMRSLGD